MNIGHYIPLPVAYLQIGYQPAGEICLINLTCQTNNSCLGREFCHPEKVQLNHELRRTPNRARPLPPEDEIMAFSGVVILRKVLSSISPVTAVKACEWLLGWLTGTEQASPIQNSSLTGLSGWLVSVFSVDGLMIQGVTPMILGRPNWTPASEEEYLLFCQRWLDYLETAISTEEEVQRLECSILWLVYHFLKTAVIESVHDDHLDLAGLRPAIETKMEAFAVNLPKEWQGEHMRLSHYSFDQYLESAYISLDVVKSLLYGQND